MRAAQVTTYGEAPELIEIEAPGEPGAFGGSQAGPAEIVDVLVAGINPVDLAIASGKFDAGAPPLPYVPGIEGIGRMADGEIVWFEGAHFPWGSMAERAVITEGSGITLVSNAAGEMIRIIRILDDGHVPTTPMPLGWLTGRWSDADGDQEQMLAILR